MKSRLPALTAEQAPQIMGCSSPPNSKFHPAWLGRVASVEDAASIAASPSQRPQQREPPQVVPMAKKPKRFSGEESKVTRSLQCLLSARAFWAKQTSMDQSLMLFGFHNSCSKLSKTFHHCEAVKGLVWFVSSPISSTCCTMKKTGMSVIFWWFTTCPCFEPVPSMTTEIVPWPNKAGRTPCTMITTLPLPVCCNTRKFLI